MCIRCKTGERLGELHAHKLYILRHCTNIVYLNIHRTSLEYGERGSFQTCYPLWSMAMLYVL
jgi:hypothetical protein